MARCRHCGRHGLAEGPAGPGSTAPSPDEGGGGLALVQLLPAAAPASRHRHRHRRALLGQCRLSSSPWPATAGRAPPPAARCRAPGTAGRRGCRTAVRGRGRPDSASRRSGGCTDGVVGLGPARAAAGLVQPRAGRDGDLPGPAHLPAAHEASPPLAWLPGSDQPTKPAGTAKPEPHRGSTVLPAGRACRARSWAGRVLGRGSLPADQVGVGPPYPCALARQVWPVDQAISPSPRASRDVAGATAGRQPRSRAGQATSCVPPWWCRARTVPQFARLGAAGRKPSLGRAGRSQ
jgi:hypothetical protein